MLFRSDPSIMYTARGALQTDYITVTAVTRNLDPASVVWSLSSGTYVHPKDEDDNDIEHVIILDCSTVLGSRCDITASVAVEGKTYSDVISLPLVYTGDKTPHNFGGVDYVPTETPSGEALVVGDYFLWADTTTVIDGFTYQKGVIYEYDGTAWEVSTNGDLVMTLFDSFADLANDVDSTIIGNAVIKKLVAIDAFIKNLVTQNLRPMCPPNVGTTYSTGLAAVLRLSALGRHMGLPLQAAV